MSRTFQSACIQLHFAVSNMASALDEAKRMEAENSVALKELREEIKQIKTDIDELLALKKTRALDDEERQLLEEKKKEKERLDGKETALTKLCEADTNRVTQLEAQQGADLLALREENARLREREAQQGAVDITFHGKKPEPPKKREKQESAPPSPAPKRAAPAPALVDDSELRSFTVRVARDCTRAQLSVEFLKKSNYLPIKSLVLYSSDAPPTVLDDNILRDLLQSNNEFPLYYTTGRKPFSNWKLTDLASVGFSLVSCDWMADVGLSKELSRKERRLLGLMQEDLKRDLIVLGELGGVEARRRVFIDTFLKFATLCFQDTGLLLDMEQDYSGSLGNGPLDYVFLFNKLAIVISEAKDAIDEGVAQAVVQLSAISEDLLMAEHKRKLEKKDVGRPGYYAVVTTGNQWRFLEMTGLTCHQSPVIDVMVNSAFHAAAGFEISTQLVFTRLLWLLKNQIERHCLVEPTPKRARSDRNVDAVKRPEWPCGCCWQRPCIFSLAPASEQAGASSA
eukprot:m.180342 g.180342  ORF g.180342 m.180342 type:complete len:511 (+) comp9990_c2_seq35:82-1614(+)